MMKAGATKVGLPKPGLHDRTRAASVTSPTSTAMKTARSSNLLASDQRLSKVSYQCSGSKAKLLVYMYCELKTHEMNLA